MSYTRTGLPLTKTVTATNVAGLEVRNSVQFGQLGFEIYIRHSSGINKLIVGYLNLALTERAKDINLGGGHWQIEHINEFIKGVSIEEKK